MSVEKCSPAPISIEYARFPKEIAIKRGRQISNGGFMKRIRVLVMVLCGVLICIMGLQAARLTLFIDGDNRTPYDASRGKVGRAEWTTVVTARKGKILTDDFQNVNIDVPADKVT